MCRGERGAFLWGEHHYICVCFIFVGVSLIIMYVSSLWNYHHYEFITIVSVSLLSVSLCWELSTGYGNGYIIIVCECIVFLSVSSLRRETSLYWFCITVVEGILCVKLIKKIISFFKYCGFKYIFYRKLYVNVIIWWKYILCCLRH